MKMNTMMLSHINIWFYNNPLQCLCKVWVDILWTSLSCLPCRWVSQKFLNGTHSIHCKTFLCFPAELEALEACYWLKAAGFPQYSQAYEGKHHKILTVHIISLLTSSVKATVKMKVVTKFSLKISSQSQYLPHHKEGGMLTWNFLVMKKLEMLVFYLTNNLLYTFKYSQTSMCGYLSRDHHTS